MHDSNDSFKFFELLKGIARFSRNILDIGCSEGSLPDDYFNVKSLVISLDNDRKLLSKNRNNIKIIGDAYLIPVRDAHFDLVIIKYVLEHIERPELIISQIRNITKKNQFVYTVVPKYYAFQDTFYRFLGRMAEICGKGKQAHISKFTFGSLCKLFYDNGFVMVDFYEADAGLSFLDRSEPRRILKRLVLLFIAAFKKLTKKNLLERNEMHFIFCKFD